MVGIGGVATAAVVQQVRLVVWVYHVVCFIVNTSEGQDIWVIVPTCMCQGLLRSSTAPAACIHTGSKKEKTFVSLPKKEKTALSMQKKGDAHGDV